MPDIFVAPAKKKPTENKQISPSIFSTYIENPKKVRFRGQHQGEETLLFLRKHWITNVGWLIVGLFLFFLPVFGLPFIDLWDILPFTLPVSYFIIGFCFWYLALSGYILINFLFWFFNVSIVSERRIIDIDFVYLLYNEISSTVMSKIEDVTYKRSGFFSTLFNYGDVFIQTAGAEPNIEFLSISHPGKVAQLITQLMHRRRLS